MKAAAREGGLSPRILRVLGEGDPLDPLPMTAAAVHAALFGVPAPADAPTVPAVERALRRLADRGLADGFHEPYSASRYMITRAGRARVGTA